MVKKVARTPLALSVLRWIQPVVLPSRAPGRPGLRWYHPHYYGAFIRDPDGQNIEAVCHAPA